MDKTMELVLVAMVLMVASVIIIAMANSQIGGFGDSIDSQRENVEGNLSEELNEIPDNDNANFGREENYKIPGSNSRSEDTLAA